ncbi:hypothetical protein V6N13_062810 [Hibiscus sabdariffa]
MGKLISSFLVPCAVNAGTSVSSNFRSCFHTSGSATIVKALSKNPVPETVREERKQYNEALGRWNSQEFLTMIVPSTS